MIYKAIWNDTYLEQFSHSAYPCHFVSSFQVAAPLPANEKGGVGKKGQKSPLSESEILPEMVG